MNPMASLSVDGTPVTGAFWASLIELSITDHAGDEADEIQAHLHDDPFFAIPRQGAVLKAALGYRETGLIDKGSYTADEIELECLPYAMHIRGRAADMREDLKTQRERHWDNKSLKDIVEDVAGAHGLKAQVAESLGAIRLPWLGQQDESDINLLHRLARRYGGLFAVKGGNLVIAERGKGESTSGAALAPLVITRNMIVRGSCRVRFSDRERHKKVVAYTDDKGRQHRKEVEVESDGDAAAILRIPTPFGTEDEAKRAAKAKSRELDDGAATLSFTIEGNPSVIAGAPLRLAGVRPGVDEIDWTIETATDRFRKDRYITEIEAKRAAPADG